MIAMEHWPQEIYDYIKQQTRFDDPVLNEMEERGRREGFPIIGPLVGPWLYFFACLIKARRIIELGSGFGYSTWYFAKALHDMDGGIVTHTVWDDALSRDARANLENAGLLHHCEFIVSEAVLALTTVEPGIDLIFMDIDKEGYTAALTVIEEKLRPGGLLLTDNVLWSGRVLLDSEESKQAGEPTPATRAVRAFNERLQESDKWQYLINPLRDGLGVAMYKG